MTDILDRAKGALSDAKARTRLTLQRTSLVTVHVDFLAEMIAEIERLRAENSQIMLAFASVNVVLNRLEKRE